MARKNILNRAVAVDSQPAEENAPEAVLTPTKANVVKVKALGYVGEEIDGKMARFEPGQVFSVSAERRAALGSQVEDVK